MGKGSINPLYAQIIPSPFPFAHIKSIHLKKDYPGTELLSSQELPQAITIEGRPVPLLNSYPIFKGEPIAVIISENKESLALAAASIELEYDIVPVMESGKEEIFTLTFKKGNLKNNKLHSETVIENSFSAKSWHHKRINPLVSSVTIKKNRLIVETQSMWLNQVKKAVSEATGMKPSELIVRKNHHGSNSFLLSWLPSLTSSIASLIALKRNRAVQLEISIESFIAQLDRFEATISSGLNEKRQLQYTEIDFTIDFGAYPFMEKEIIQRSVISFAGIYQQAAVKITGHAVKSHQAPFYHPSKLGPPQASWALEIHVNSIIHEIEEDPYLWRKSHYKKDCLLVSSDNRQNIMLEEMIESLITKSDFRRKYAAYMLREKSALSSIFYLRGIGLSFAFQGSGFSGENERLYPASVSATLDNDGILTIESDGLPFSSAHKKIIYSIVKENLEIDESKIQVNGGSTEIPYSSGPDIFSRNSVIIFPLIKKACQGIAKKRFREALPITQKRKFILPRNYMWDEKKLKGTAYPAIAYAAAVLEVEIDPASYLAYISKVYLAVNCGAFFDEKTVKSQLYKSCIDAVNLCYEKDYNTQYYHHPAKMPEIDIQVLPAAKQSSPAGISNIPLSVIPSAYISAMNQITDTPLETLGISPEQIFNSVKK